MRELNNHEYSYKLNTYNYNGKHYSVTWLTRQPDYDKVYTVYIRLGKVNGYDVEFYYIPGLDMLAGYIF